MSGVASSQTAQIPQLFQHAAAATVIADSEWYMLQQGFPATGKFPQGKI